MYFFQTIKIGILNKSPIILGGIYFTFSLILLAPEIFNTIKIICILLLFLGLSSDKNYLSNPFNKINFTSFYFVYFDTL